MKEERERKRVERRRNRLKGRKNSKEKFGLI